MAKKDWRFIKYKGPKIVRTHGIKEDPHGFKTMPLKKLGEFVRDSSRPESERIIANTVLFWRKLGCPPGSKF